MKYFIGIGLGFFGASGAFALEPLGNTNPAEIYRYGEDSRFAASFPIEVEQGRCTASFIDVDGDLFLITAAHCVENSKSIKILPRVHRTTGKVEESYLPETVLELAVHPGYFNQEKKKADVRFPSRRIHDRLRRWSMDDRNDPVKVLPLLIETLVEVRAFSHLYNDVAFVSLRGISIPSHIKPYKIYKGSKNELIGKRFVAVGYGPQSSDGLFYLLGQLAYYTTKCWITGDCDDPETYLPQAADLRFYAEAGQALVTLPAEDVGAVSASLVEGDSGGPSLIEDGAGNFMIAAVHSFGLKGLESDQDWIVRWLLNDLKKKGRSDVDFDSFVDPSILEMTRFKMHGLVVGNDDEEAKLDEARVREAMTSGLLGKNHDSRGGLLLLALEQGLQDLTMSLVTSGVSDICDFKRFSRLSTDGSSDALFALVSKHEDGLAKWINSLDMAAIWDEDASPYTRKSKLVALVYALKNKNQAAIEGCIRDITYRPTIRIFFDNQRVLFSAKRIGLDTD